MSSNSEIDRLIAEVDTTHIKTNQARQVVVDKLLPIVQEMEIDPYAKSTQIEGQMGIVNTLLSTLNDQDKAIISRTNIRLRQKEDSNTEALGKIVTEILARTQLNAGAIGGNTERGTADLNACGAKLEDLGREQGVIILPTEMRDDADDLA